MMHTATWPSRRPIQTLILSFVAWKLLILIVATCSLGQGYDTSTQLGLASHSGHGQLPWPLELLINKLVRWDAIYIIKIADRGYRLYEQEWFTGWGFTELVALFTAGKGASSGSQKLKLTKSVVRKAGVPAYRGLEGVVAIIIAHTSHLLSSLTLFKLTAILFPGSSALPLNAAFLHVISPAGIFLSAPYAESSCAFLSFLGCVLFVKSLGSGKPTLGKDALILTSGVIFGIATTFRSNGILYGSLLLEEAFLTFFLLKDGPRLTTLRRLLATGLGGLSVGAGLVLPQYIAYKEYCTTDAARPWCEKTIPSIYTFVQDHYW